MADDLLARVEKQIDAIRIGDPTQRPTLLGPVVNERATRATRATCRNSRIAARSSGAAAGSRTKARSPAASTSSRFPRKPPSDPLWKHEMFLPILMAQRYRDRDEAMRRERHRHGPHCRLLWIAGRSELVPGPLEAGLTYANRGQGATTGAWPGYQAFGGWKGSGSSGKAIASAYYLPLYLREQSRTVVE